MTSTQKRAIRDAVTPSADSIRFLADGTIVAKRFFFYRHGATAEGFGARILADVEAITGRRYALVAEDHFNQWPKDSFFLARLTPDASAIRGYTDEDIKRGLSSMEANRLAESGPSWPKFGQDWR